MEYFEAHGAWFLPGGLRVTGTLTFSADGLVLKVLGPLLQARPTEEVPEGSSRRHPCRPLRGRTTSGGRGGRRHEGGRGRTAKLKRLKNLLGRGRRSNETKHLSTDEWGVLPLIYGVDEDQRDITLVGSFGMTTQFPDLSEQTFNVTLALVGKHISNAEFSGIRAQFDHLAEWAAAPEIASVRKNPRQIQVNGDATEIMKTSWKDSVLTLESGIVGNSSGDKVHVDRYCTFAAESSPREWSELLDIYLRPFHDLLILSLGRYVHMNEVEFRTAGSDDWFTAYFNMVSPQRGQLKSSSLQSYSSPTLLTAESTSIPLADLVPAWYSLHERLRTVVTLIHAPLYAPFTYSEHRYASIFQGIEAYHKLEGEQFDSRDLTRPEHRLRVKQVVAVLKAGNLPAEHVRWAKAVIEGRNDKPLKTKVEEVVLSTGYLGQCILAAAPSFCSAAYDARTGVSHGGADKGVTATSRHWFGEILLLSMRVRLLQHLGVEQVGERALKRPRFEFALEQAALESSQA
ncbi:HEPN domain-containing protein [Streptomyces ortus]|uniref:ApeA N-terminal domain-containing protein n=1 Tax=Streptomyces ortus TaxID=2867268 RepID=A0ABT3UW94_9ACTN|nr:HEPN domain-containing protein [Streptomyces ortus]MCX4231833.1 hypothetical protein [Streptomyces ortus]